MTVTIDRPTTGTKVCPDGLPWCVDHSVEDGEHWHRGYTEVIAADRNGLVPQREVDMLEVRAVLVNNVDGTPDPAVWLSGKYPLPPHVYLEDGVGLSPARAREFGLLLVQLAGHLDGGATATGHYEPGTYPCPAGLSWCNDEAADHEPGEERHFSGEMYLPATAAAPHHRVGKLGRMRLPDRVSLLVAQSEQEEPTICLNLVRVGDELGIVDDAEMTLDEAEQLGLFLLAQVATLRGGEVR